MNKKLIEECAAILRKQSVYRDNDPTDQEQSAYYDGMRVMFEYIVTNGYQDMTKLDEIPIVK